MKIMCANDQPMQLNTFRAIVLKRKKNQSLNTSKKKKQQLKHKLYKCI